MAWSHKVTTNAGFSFPAGFSIATFHEISSSAKPEAKYLP